MTRLPAKQAEHEPSRRRALAAAVLALMLGFAVPAQASLPSSAPVSIEGQIDHGHFAQARRAIEQALAQKDLTARSREALAFQQERMRRILLDFSLTAEDAKARIRKQIPDLTDAEFARWDQAGLIEHMVIDGRTLYFNRAPSNLFLLSAEARSRRAASAPSPPPNGPNEILNDHHRAAFRAALDSGKAGVLPMRVRVTQTVTVDPDAVPAGERIKAWIPYPRAIPGQQDDIRFVASQPAGARVAPVDTLQRTAYMEAPAKAGRPTVFKLTYELTLRAQVHPIDPDKVVRTPITPALAPFVAERAPHVVFTDDLRAFSRKVVGDETNPYRIAQKLFAAVDAIPWAGAREYSTLSNISDYTLHAGHGDCGEQTMLLIALLRLNGIPARWQSGWMFSDGHYDNIHDWAQAYFAPYGWVPVDVTFGQLEPKAGDDPRLRWFYLGGIDAYRIAFNDDYGRPFVPAKTFPRSDTVDSQRGEVEWRGGNLYFNQWDYHFDWQFLHDSSAPAKPTVATPAKGR